MTSLTSRLRSVHGRYSEEQPLRGYNGVMAVFGGLAGGAVAAALATGRRPDVRLADLVWMTGAVFQGSRLIAKDAVTSPLRAPFTRFEGPAGAAEVNEEVTAPGGRHAVGELLTCPFCLSVWIAGGLAAGLTFVPKLTRLAGIGLTAVACSDFLQLGYDAAKKTTGNTGG
jgi:hypothetical protein